jgi:hypothetical protein
MNEMAHYAYLRDLFLLGALLYIAQRIGDLIGILRPIQAILLEWEKRQRPDLWDDEPE